MIQILESNSFHEIQVFKNVTHYTRCLLNLLFVFCVCNLERTCRKEREYHMIASGAGSKLLSKMAFA